MKPIHADRRAFLKTAGAVLGAAALPGALRGATPALFDARAGGLSGLLPDKKYKTERVILIAFAGGVRSRDTIGAPANVPNLMKIAKAGVTFPNAHCGNLGHFGATLSILTGVDQYAGIRENDRGENPTVFEYLRKQLGYGANDVWLSATGGVQQQNLTYSYHRSYGSKYGANLISSDGIFNAEFQSILNSFGTTKAPTEAEGDVLQKLRGALADSAKARGVPPGELNTPESLRSLEKFIQDELTGETARITGPGAGDAKTVRVAANIFRGFKPKVTGVVLQQADVAHGSYNGYVEVIRRNDEEIGRLWNAIQFDRKLRETTSIFILPEFGRNKDLNERNGLDHGDGTPDLTSVALIAAGPDFKQDKILKTEIRTIDVCPTICELLGAKPDVAKSKAIRDAFV